MPLPQGNNPGSHLYEGLSHLQDHYHIMRYRTGLQRTDLTHCVIAMFSTYFLFIFFRAYKPAACWEAKIYGQG